MKKISTLIVALLMFLGFSATTVSAQPDPQEMIQMQVDRFKPAMGLNDAQTETFKTILTEQSKKMMEMFESAQGDFEGMMEKMEALNKEVNDKITKAFGQDIFNKYEAERTKMMQEMMQF